MDRDFEAIGADSERGRLFFAGEHTSGKWRGTVHGAFVTGVHAAARVVRLLDVSAAASTRLSAWILVTLAASGLLW
jgi:hypothetical protein